MAAAKRAGGKGRARLADVGALAFAFSVQVQHAAQFQPIEILALGEKLETALETARNARSLIADAQEIVRAQPYRDDTAIEHAARDYQIDLIEWQLTRAADIAEERTRYFAAITTPEQVCAELAKCADGVEGTLHWFRYYAWGYDPRPDSPLQVMPFGLFDFQESYIRWLENLVFGMRSSGLVEKARDMGATVGALAWIAKQWLFREGFSAMLTSATEDLVDSKKDPDTLFEKVRFLLQHLPSWMLPAGFSLEKDLTYMNIANPANGSVITGSAPTSKVGRQRRRTLVLMDEFATYPQGGYPQYVALSQTAKTLLALATPEGKFNKYAEWRHSGNANVFTMDWREHPWKDKRWRDSLTYGYVGPPMSEQNIAQEIERNYDAAQPGKVFPEWREEYCLITWAELVAYYEQFRLGQGFRRPDGSYRVPEDWNWARTHDYGQTEGHPWIVAHAAKPRAAYPLNDSLFVFSVHQVTPTGATPAEFHKQVVAIEQRLGWRDRGGNLVQRYEFSENSHEAAELRRTLLDEHGEEWEAWNTDYSLGIPQIKEWLQLIEPTRPNPIRPALNGRARIYFVAPDDQYRLAFNEKSGGHFVTASKNESGFRLLREEFPAYHYPPEEAGKALKAMRPEKIKDDCCDTIRAFATHWGPSVAPLTKEERIEKKLPERLRAASVDEGKVAVTDGWQMARAKALAYVEKQSEYQDMSEWEAAFADTV